MSNDTNTTKNTSENLSGAEALLTSHHQRDTADPEGHFYDQTSNKSSHMTNMEGLKHEI